MSVSNIQNPPSFFVSLPTESVSSAAEFYKALSFTPIPEYSDSETIALRFPDSANANICVMVHSHPRFKDFIRADTSIAEAQKVTGAIYTLAVRSRQDVDGFLENAVAAGGKKDPFVMEAYGKAMGLYTRSFEDLDGHIWEATAMIGDEGKDEK